MPPASSCTWFIARPDGSVQSRFDYTYDDLGRRTSMTTLEGTTNTSTTGPAGSPVSLAGRADHSLRLRRRRQPSRVTDNGATTAYTVNELNQYVAFGADQPDI